MSSIKIFVVAGEVSGDIHAAYLVRRLKHYMPELKVYAMGGDALRSTGAEIVCDVTHRSTIGFAEVFRHALPIFKSYYQLKTAIRKVCPQLVLLVDYQGFNVTLAESIREQGVPVFYYIAPQEWIWGSPQGARKVGRLTDRIFTIFKGEDTYYRAVGAKVEYVGHPLLDIVKTTDPAQFRQRYNIQPHEKVVALFPGSRAQEINKLLPLIIATATELKQRKPELRFFLPISSKIFRKDIEATLSRSPIPIQIIDFEDRYDLMAVTHVAMAVSGTVTLELSILEVPMIITYAISALSYWFAKYVLHIKIRHVGLPNIVADMQIVPEFVQKKAQPQLLANEIQSLIDDPVRHERMKSNLRTVKRKLGEPGAIDRVAHSIYTFLVA